MMVMGLGIGVTKAGLPPEKHPSLLFERQELDTIRGRLGERPYREWLKRLERWCSSPPLDESRLSQTERAHRAKALAFLYTLTRERRYGEGCEALIAKVRPPSRGGKWRGLDEIVEATASYAVAYDLLANYLRGNQALEAKTRLLLYDLGRELYTSQYVWPSPGGDTRTIRQFSALGLCALAIRDFDPPGNEPGPAVWYRRARSEIPAALQRQVCRDGSYAEGPGRHFEAAKLYLAFLIADRIATGETVLDDQGLLACEWSVRIRMPNGLRPNLDSSAVTPSISYAMTAATADSGLYRWDAQGPEFARAVPDDQLPEALSWYDITKPAVPPSWHPSGLLEACGDVFIRSGWDSSAAYLSLRGERSKARLAGGVFEQPDATSLMLCMGDETLVMDTGYGGWQRRHETRRGDSHNLVLVDGQGPPIKTTLGAVLSVGSDVETKDAVFDRGVSAVRVACSHHDTQFERALTFVAGEDAVVFDRAAAAEGEHDFSWLMHVNAGGDTGGLVDLQGDRAVVHRPGASLQLVLTSTDPDGAPLAAKTDTHFIREDQEPLRHTLVTKTVHDSEKACFLSVLSPRHSGDRFPVVETRRGRGWLGAIIDGRTRVLFRTSGSARLGSGPVTTDGVGLQWASDSSGRPSYVLALGAKHIWVGERLVWSSDKPQGVVWRAPERKSGRVAAGPNI